MIKCSRCGSTAPIIGSVEMRMPQLVAVSHYCAGCVDVLLQAVFDRVETPTSLVIMTDAGQDIDIAEHHPACRCHDCDPDFHMESMREERLAC